MATALLIGRDHPATAELAVALGARAAAPPPVPSDDGAGGGLAWSWAGVVDAWAAELAAGDPVDHLVVCAWDPGRPAVALTDLDLERWSAEVEVELATWSAAVVAATTRCAPGGSVVVVVERPSPLDADGRATTLAVAEGLAAFARSAALVHGARGVRVNVVSTACWTVPTELLGMAPALPTYPGTVGREVAGAVRACWSEDLDGVTGTIVRADGGRSW